MSLPFVVLLWFVGCLILLTAFHLAIKHGRTDEWYGRKQETQTIFKFVRQ